MRKTKEKSFKEYYQCLSLAEKVDLRDKFLQMADLKYPTWYTKLKDSNFSKLELDALSRLCGEKFVN